MLAALLALSSAAFRVHVTVHADRPLGEVSSILIGGNLVAYQPNGYGDTSPNSTDRGQGIWDPDHDRPVAGMAQLAREQGIRVARWPGGCASHLYRWKETIGRPDSRPQQRFGLPEYLRFCADIHAEPLITVAEYYGAASDAADLVEYLDAPADAAHPWALRRAADGHPEPWHVRWFEFGNESEHGPHTSANADRIAEAYSPAEYARRYLLYRAAMRRIDPSIKLGAVVATGQPALQGWPEGVLKGIGPSLDFAIHHIYFPQLGDGGASIEPSTLFSESLGAIDQEATYLDDLRRVMREAAGRDDVPIAVTEFNGGFVQEQPVPYRHSLGNALGIAELAMLFRDPRYRIVFANQWEFPNEYWGAVRGYADLGQPLVCRPQYWPLAMIAAHAGTARLAADVDAPTYDVAAEPRLSVQDHRGSGSRFRLLGEPGPVTGPWQASESAGFDQTIVGDTVITRFAGTDVNYYHARKTIAVKPSTWYRVTAQVRTQDLAAPNGATIQVGDDRGWLATHSVTVPPSVTGTHDWQTVTADYLTLADAKGIEIIARRLSGAGPATGAAAYRIVSIQEFVPDSYPAASVVMVDASATLRGTTVLLVNRDMARPAAVTIDVSGMSASRAEGVVLAGPSVDSTNEVDPNLVRTRPLTVARSGSGWAAVVPPHSFAAIELVR